jgi:hypothetical protein
MARYPAVVAGDDAGHAAREHVADGPVYHQRPDGSSNTPMRTANSHMDLAVICARRGDLDETIDHGLSAFSFERKTEASLPSRAADLDRILGERYPRERMADEFRQRYIDAGRTLRRRALTSA